MIKKKKMQAAQMAGLSVEFIINEPTAAALAYAKLSKIKNSGLYAIYDLGGGTFDCTIANINGDEVDIVTSQGVSKLGGKDFDEQLLEIVKKEVQKNYQKRTTCYKI